MLFQDSAIQKDLEGVLDYRTDFLIVYPCDGGDAR